MKQEIKKSVKGPGMADVYDVAKNTLHQKTYAKTPEDIVDNIVDKK